MQKQSKTAKAARIALHTSVVLCIFAAWFVLWGCRAPKNGNSVLYLYVSENNKQTSREIFTAAAAAARKYGAKLVLKDLDELPNFGKLLSLEINQNARDSPNIFQDMPQNISPNMSKKISLGLVLYPSDWNAENQALLADFGGAKPQINAKLRISVWLLSRNKKAEGFIIPKMPNRAHEKLDAISSPSTTRPAKAAAKKFFAGLLEY